MKRGVTHFDKKLSRMVEINIAVIELAHRDVIGVNHDEVTFPVKRRRLEIIQGAHKIICFHMYCLKYACCKKPFFWAKSAIYTPGMPHL
jgi:hypothetical protein